MEPTAEKTVTTTRYGKRKIVTAVAMTVDETTRAIEEIGTLDFFWAAVRAQLRPSIGGDGPVVGRLVKNGNRYVLTEVTAETMAAIEKQIDF